MDFDRLRDAWSQQPDARPERSDEEWIRLVLGRDRALRHRVLVRDFIELGTACVLAAGFAWKAAGAAVRWPWLSAAIIMAALAATFVRERRRQRLPAAPAGNLRAVMVEALAEIEHQVRLLGSVAVWYLLPIAVVVLLTVAGSVLERRAGMDATAWARMWPSLVVPVALVLVVCGAAFGGVWWLNRSAVRRHLLPYRQALVTSLRQLDAADEGEEGR